MHSVKNRFLMRIKNMTFDLYRKHWLAITARDVVVLGCCLLYEHYSLKAFWLLFKSWRKAWAMRKWIMARRRVDDEYIAGWFRFTPVSRPAPRKSGVLASRTRTQIAES
jgi:hypothetical protein